MNNINLFNSLANNAPIHINVGTERAYLLSRTNSTYYDLREGLGG